MSNEHGQSGFEIAIIGMAGRFPGAENLDKFWQNLSNGIETIRFLSKEELCELGRDKESLNNKDFVPAHGVSDGYDLFDADFFGFSPREAEIMDPQHRIFLEIAHEALETAAYNPKSYSGSIGVFAGVSASNYLYTNVYKNLSGLSAVDDFQVNSLNQSDFLTTRISYKLNLNGPSFTVQSACSTSLVAIHIACQQLISGACDIALAGGISLTLPQHWGYYYDEGMIASPDGHCRAFDENAKGCLKGDGGGIVVLKLAADAIRDGDHIDAIILGSAINNDGAHKVGYAAPGLEGQIEVIRSAQIIAGIEPDSISYIEAHGTGTPVGDPIEISALTQAFRKQTQRKQFCAVGSVKTNFGHLDAAAGIAGFIKTVLAIKNKTIPPSLHFKKPNPQIDFKNSPFYINNKCKPWNIDDHPLRAGVSSFGIGGTNAHLILEEVPPDSYENAKEVNSEQLILLSARSEQTLNTMTGNLANYLKKHPGLNLEDVAYTLQVGRESFKYRKALVCNNMDEMISILNTGDPKRLKTGYVQDKSRPVVFLFPGQGAQYVNMGLGLYRSETIFREQIDLCANLLQSNLDIDIRDLLFPEKDEALLAGERLTRTCYTQPVLFTIEYALAKLWTEWGIQPKAMIGHSIGEYVAAVLSGVFTLEDGLSLVAVRGRMIQALPKGSMLAIPMSSDEVSSLLNEDISLSAINAPHLCVVSGNNAAIDGLEKRLSAQDIVCRRLHTSHAFHSPMMSPVLDAFQERVSRVKLSSPQIPYISNLTGTWITENQAMNPEYWRNHLRHTVRFSDGVQELLKNDSRIFLEVGPGNTLSTLVKHNIKKSDSLNLVTSMRHPNDQSNDEGMILNALGLIWLNGAKVDWESFYRDKKRKRIPLPTYSFERHRYWVDAPKEALTAHTPGVSLRKKPDIKDWFYVPSWKRAIEPCLSRDGDASQERSTWLFFINECELGNSIVKRLEKKGHHVVTVTPGKSYKRITDRAFSIDPGKRADYDSLLKELRSLDKIPAKIVHLWGVTLEGQDRTGLETLDQTLETGFYSLFYLAQALGDQNIWDPLQIKVVTSNVYEVTGKEALCPAKATVLGPCKVIPVEYSNITCCHVDIVLPRPGNVGEKMLVEQLTRELTGKSSDPIVAYRGYHRWVQTFEPAWLGQVTEGGGVSKLREGGVYLITGGLGGIGLVLAEYLVRTMHAKLILVGRTPLPERDDWGKWLAEPVKMDMAEEACDLDQLEKRISEELAIKPMLSYEGLEQTLDVLCVAYIHEYLWASGLNTEKGESYSKVEFRGRLKILPKFEKFYNFMIKILEEDGIVRSKGDKLEFLKDRDEMKPSSILKAQAMEKYPEFVGIFRLLEHCVKHYNKALTGEIPAISVLYPDGSSELMRNCEATLSQHTTSRIYEVLLKEVISKITSKPRGRKLRILEVGGGNAILTRQIISTLKDHDIEYFFTDLGMSFVRNAQKEPSLQDLDFMKFGVLDISKDPVKQGFEKNSFDIILGLNVVHATRSIEETTGNLKDLLTPNGIMFLIEAVRLQRWVDMVWGLAEGWWYFEDQDIRSDSPLMTIDKWEEVLKRQGFSCVRAFPRSEVKRVEADTGLISAQKEAEYVSSENLDSLSETYKSNRFEVQSKIRKLMELEQLGAEVMVASADVSDLEQMEAVKAEACKRFGAINGIIHSALVLNDGIIQLKTSEIAASVLSPKVRGTLVLDTLFKDAKLDFFAIFSSLSSILGGAGQVDYCAASAFLDAYANTCCGRNGVFTVSIDWGAWREVGMFLNVTLEHNERPEDALSEGMSNKEGLEAFNRIISSQFPQVLVSTMDLQALMQRSLSTERAVSEEEPKETHPSGAAHQRHQEANPYVAPRNEVERILANIWQELLGVEQASIHDNFFDLGGDSVISLQIIAKVNQAGIRFTNQQIFEHQTIAELAAAVGSDQASEADQDIIHRQPPEQAPYATSDFPGARLSKKDIDCFVNKISKSDGKLTK